MAKNLSDSRKKRNHRIRGDIRPLLCPEFCELRNRILRGFYIPDDVVACREIFKQLIADRLRTVLQRYNLYEPLTRTESLLDALAQRHQDAGLCRFLACILMYYNSPEMCEHHIQSIPGTNGSSDVRGQKKALTNAFRSIWRASYVLMRPVLINVAHEEKELGRGQIELVGKYRSMARATSFIYILFRDLYIKPLPSRISIADFEQVRNIYPQLGNYYVWDEEGYYLRKRENRPAAACIGVDAAMELFIQRLPS